MERQIKLERLQKDKGHLDDTTMKTYRKNTQSAFHAMKTVICGIQMKNRDNKIEDIPIKIPPRFVIQNFFDDAYEKGVNDPTFLFRELHKGDNTKGKNNDLSYKLFLDWNVQYDSKCLIVHFVVSFYFFCNVLIVLPTDPVKVNTSIKGQTEEQNNNMKAVDEGGPTSQFISDLCMQLNELSVVVNFDINSKEKSNHLSYDDYDIYTDLLVPTRGSKVRHSRRRGTVVDVLKDKEGSQRNKTSVMYDIVLEDRKEHYIVKRSEFMVTGVPLKIFEMTPSGLAVVEDDFFLKSFAMFKSQNYQPCVELNVIEDQARRYYRAVGRFLFHVISHGKDPIPTFVMPEFYRNGEYFMKWLMAKNINKRLLL